MPVTGGPRLYAVTGAAVIGAAVTGGAETGGAIMVTGGPAYLPGMAPEPAPRSCHISLDRFSWFRDSRPLPLLQPSLLLSQISHVNMNTCPRPWTSNISILRHWPAWVLKCMLDWQVCLCLILDGQLLHFKKCFNYSCGLIATFSLGWYKTVRDSLDQLLQQTAIVLDHTWILDSTEDPDSFHETLPGVALCEQWCFTLDSSMMFYGFHTWMSAFLRTSQTLLLSKAKPWRDWNLKGTSYSKPTRQKHGRLTEYAKLPEFWGKFQQLKPHDLVRPMRDNQRT